MIAARARELTDGKPGQDHDLVLARCFADYDPPSLPEPEPGAWMPHCQWPIIVRALDRNHAGGGQLGKGLR